MATIAGVIAEVNAVRPNQFTSAQKIRWLSELDGMIFTGIISRHEGAPETFSGYDTDADPETALLAVAPHDIIYRHYLTAQIDLANQELIRYNNTSRLFNEAFQEFRAWYTRSHMPLQPATHFKL